MRVPQVPPALLLLVSFYCPAVSLAQSVQGRKLLLANPSSESFGTASVGSSRALTETITNSGSRDITVSKISLSSSTFKVQGITLPLVLAGGQSYTFSVVFAPSSAVSSSGSLTLVSDAANPALTVSLSGAGSSAGLLTANPSSLSFGSIPVGSSKNLSMSLAASGTSITITSASSTSSEFAISGVSFPVTISAGQSKTFSAIFTARASGAASGTLKFTSNAANSPTAENLSGTGGTASTHSVTLSWKAGSTGSSGYNIYRSIASGGPYSKLNSVLNSSSTYVDSSVAGGKTYYYVTTAVSSSGTESKYSNQVAAAVPGP